MPDPKLNLALQAENERIESAESVLSALRNHGGQLVEKLGSKAPGVRGAETGLTEADPAPTAQSMVDWYQAWVARLRDGMVTAGRHYRQAKAHRSAAGRVLGETARAGRKAAQGIRDQFFSTYGEEYSLDLGVARRVPPKAKALLEYLRYLDERLANPKEPLPEVAAGRVGIDLAAQQAALASLIADLEVAILAYDDARRQAHAAMVDKDDAIDVYDNDFVWVSTAVEAMFRAAGMERQASQVRPSRRRRFVVTQSVDDPGTQPSGEEPSADEPVSAATDEPSPDAADEPVSAATDEPSPDASSAREAEAAE